jgi:hypothetical protein
LLRGDALAAFEEPISDVDLLRGFAEELRENDPGLYEEMLDEVGDGSSAEGFTAAEVEAALFDTIVHRALRWGRQLTYHRVRIAEALMSGLPPLVSNDHRNT